jgi:hypothetical protein
MTATPGFWLAVLIFLATVPSWPQVRSAAEIGPPNQMNFGWANKISMMIEIVRFSPCSFAKFAENEIMIFSMSVAPSTVCLSRRCQLPMGPIVSGETHEFPSSARGITSALL